MKDDRAVRFDLLDGLRGIAAILVMLYHYCHHNGVHELSGAWAAVDLFFVLSGLVIAHSYGQKIAQGLGFGRYLYLRLARLGPMYLLGLLLGVVAAALALWRNPLSTADAGQLTTAALLNALWLPYFNDAAWAFGSDAVTAAVFPLNDPAWSLFFELLVNIGFFWFVLSRRALSDARLVLPAMALYLASTLLLGEINPGWTTGNFVYGLPRVTAGFFLGALIYQWRLHQRPVPPTIAFGAAGLMLACFFVGNLYVTMFNTLVAIPLSIATLSAIGARPAWQWLCHWLGELSYPLYILHVPIYRLTWELTPLQSLPVAARITLVAILTAALSLLLARADARLRKHLMARAPGARHAARAG